MIEYDKRIRGFYPMIILRSLQIYFSFFDRIKDYRKILSYVIDKGYKCISLIDYFSEYIKRDEKVIILRHDIDEKSRCTRSFFEIEKELGVKSTFYFRWSTVDLKLIEEIRNYGSEVGLHYETVAMLAQRKGITSREQVTEDFIKECAYHLRDEIEQFRKEFGEIYSVSSHGHPINRKIGVSNNIIFEYFNPGWFGIKFEAYDKLLINSLDIYISDGDIFYGFWRYGMNPMEAADIGKNKILFLSHPHHWDRLNLSGNVMKKVYTAFAGRISFT